MPQTSLIYGPSGVGKTSQLFRLVRYLLKKARETQPNAKARLIHADGGGYAPFEQSGYISKGYVDVFDIKYRQEMIADTRRLSEGKWPVKNRKGELEFSASAYSQDWSEYPVLVIEGLTSIANNLIFHLADQEAGAGFKFSYKIVEGEYTVGGLQEGHYGVIQKEVQKAIVRGFNTIPCKYVIWSALRAKAQDKESREFVLGPEVVGSAMTHKVPSLLGSTFYLESAVGKVKDSEETFRYVKAHFESGIDAELNLPFVAKCRVLEDAYPALKAVFKKGYVPCVAGKSGLERYFEVEEEILKEYSLD